MSILLLIVTPRLRHRLGEVASSGRVFADRPGEVLTRKMSRNCFDASSKSVMPSFRSWIVTRRQLAARVIVLDGGERSMIARIGAGDTVSGRSPSRWRRKRAAKSALLPSADGNPLYLEP